MDQHQNRPRSSASAGGIRYSPFVNIGPEEMQEAMKQMDFSYLSRLSIDDMSKLGFDPFHPSFSAARPRRRFAGLSLIRRLLT